MRERDGHSAHSRARNLGANDFDPPHRRAMSAHPIDRLGMPDDIAKGIVFLASDDAAFMTGAGLAVDDGLTPQPAPGSRSERFGVTDGDAENAAVGGLHHGSDAVA